MFIHTKGGIMVFFRSNCTINETSPVQKRGLGNYQTIPPVFKACVISDLGRVHCKNEDNCLLCNQINETCANRFVFSVKESNVHEPWHIAGVFDGISSGENAEFASKVAAAIFQRVTGSLNETTTEEEVDQLIRAAFFDASRSISRMKQFGNGVGTTGTVLCTNLKAFKVFHLGDSRAYLIRNHRLFQLTRDQTLAQLKLDAGLYEKCCSEIESDSHILTDYIGRNPDGYPVESQWISVQKNDRILLCTDGLYDMCTDSEIIKKTQETRSPQEQARRLVDAALEKGGMDNVTCIVIHFSQEGEQNGDLRY